MTLSDLEWPFHTLHAISTVAEFLLILAVTQNCSTVQFIKTKQLCSNAVYSMRSVSQRPSEYATLYARLHWHMLNTINDN